MKARIIRQRIAGPNHAVTTLEKRGGYRHEPCAECPWRRDRPTGVFPAQAYRLSAPTAYDAAWSMFGCHMSKTAAPLTCAGFLLSYGAQHNIMVRLALANGRLDLDNVSSSVPLFRTYRQMAEANGVSPNDPVLSGCRAQPGASDRCIRDHGGSRWEAARMTVEGCPRIFTKEQMIAGLKSGKTFVVDRRDAPELPELLQMERDGLVVSRFVEYDEQSSELKFRWKS